MRFLLRPHGPGRSGRRIVEPCFLQDVSAVFDDADLPAGFVLDRLLDESGGVHVLDFAARSEFARARRTHRYVDVGPEIAVLHVSVAGSQVTHDLPKLEDVGGGLLRASEIRARIRSPSGRRLIDSNRRRNDSHPCRGAICRHPAPDECDRFAPAARFPDPFRR